MARLPSVSLAARKGEVVAEPNQAEPRQAESRLIPSTRANPARP